jgi:hypothetical protein
VGSTSGAGVGGSGLGMDAVLLFDSPLSLSGFGGIWLFEGVETPQAKIISPVVNTTSRRMVAL